MCCNQSDQDIEAILYFSKTIREDNYLNGGELLTKDLLGAILNESPRDIQKFIRQNYAPQPMRNFLDTHYEVFLIYGTGCKARVDVASEETVNDYLNFLYPSNFKAKEPKNAKVLSSCAKEAITYFSDIMRIRALKDQTGVVCVKDFDDIFREAPSHIRDFVSNQFLNFGPFKSFDQFISCHYEIFPESTTGLSVRVKSRAKVLDYIAEESNLNHLSGSDSKPVNLQGFLVPTLTITNSINKVPPTLKNTTDNVTDKGGNINSKDKTPSRTADQSKVFESSKNIEKTSESFLEIPTFQTKPGFNCSSNGLIKSDQTNFTFIEANYGYDDFIQELISKTILNSESNENSECNQRNIECQTISSGQILISQLYQK